jgi:hypothetical protein
VTYAEALVVRIEHGRSTRLKVRAKEVSDYIFSRFEPMAPNSGL